MKKLGMIAFFLLLLFLLPPPPVWAEGSAVDVGAVEEALDEEAREIGGELKTDGSYDLDGALARLWARAKRTALEKLRGELREMTRIAALAVLCCVAESLCGEARIRELISICACAAVTIPLIYAYLALCVCRSIFPNAVLNAAVSMSKWLAVSMMTLLTTGVSAYIGLTAALTGGADAMAVKGTKTVIASALPVVGGILSDAASVVLAGAAVIKNAAGVFALIGVCALSITPFAAIGAKLLLFRLCAAIAAAAEGKRLAGLLGDMGSALGMLLGVLGSLTLLLFLSFMAAIRTVSA